MDLPMPVVSIPERIEPGVFGILRPVLLLPEDITERLPPKHLDAVIAHELCHIQRRDNLTTAIHMMVEALFWFHPLVWWIKLRLTDEQERACDEQVLLLGGDPQVYSESILKICEFFVTSPLACVSGITGSDFEETYLPNHEQSKGDEIERCRKGGACDGPNRGFVCARAFRVVSTTRASGGKQFQYSTQF
jgi:hypothetical protein